MYKVMSDGTRNRKGQSKGQCEGKIMWETRNQKRKKLKITSKFLSEETGQWQTNRNKIAEKKNNSTVWIKKIFIFTF